MFASRESPLPEPNSFMTSISESVQPCSMRVTRIPWHTRSSAPPASVFPTMSLTEPIWEVREVVPSIIDGKRRYLLKWERAPSLEYPDPMPDCEQQQRSQPVEPKTEDKSRAKLRDRRRGAKMPLSKRKAPAAIGDAAASSSSSSIDYADREVARILATYTQPNGRRVFQVRWRGCRMEEDTWMLEDDIHADKLVEQFERKLAGRPPRRKRRQVRRA